MVDIGEAGRLLGVEADLSGATGVAEPAGDVSSAVATFDAEARTLYLALDPAPAPNARSASTQARAGLDAEGRLLSLEVPRRGAGFEISYPSGNQ